jgi:non-specific serine/threonine protein kinase
MVAIERGDHQQATALALQARDASREQHSMAGPLLLLSNLAMVKGDFDRAQQLCDGSNDVMRRAGEIWGLGIGLLAAAGLSLNRKDLAAARGHLSEALSLNEELEDPRGIAWSLDMVAGLLFARGHLDKTARLWGAADVILQRIGIGLPPHAKWIRDRCGEVVKTALGPDSFDAAISGGRGMSTEHAIALARQELQ